MSFRISTEAICLIYRIGFRVPVVINLLQGASKTHILLRRGYTDLEKSRYALRFFVVLFECCRSLVRRGKAKTCDKNRCRIGAESVQKISVDHEETER